MAGLVALPKQRPTLIMAPDREAVLAKAYEWIELQLRSANDPHESGAPVGRCWS